MPIRRRTVGELRSLSFVDARSNAVHDVLPDRVRKMWVGPQGVLAAAPSALTLLYFPIKPPESGLRRGSEGGGVVVSTVVRAYP